MNSEWRLMGKIGHIMTWDREPGASWPSKFGGIRDNNRTWTGREDKIRTKSILTESPSPLQSAGAIAHKLQIITLGKQNI